jgi:TPR repeat protein
MQIDNQSLPNPTLIRSRETEVEDDRNLKKQKTETGIDHGLTISSLDTSNTKPLAPLTIGVQDQQFNPAINSIFSNNFHVQSIIEYKHLGDDYLETDKTSAFQCYMHFIEKDGPLLFPQSNADFYKKMGDMWSNGWGCEKNYGEALKCYQEASHCGNMDAHKKIGEMHLFGQGVIPNGWKAIEYLQHPQLQNDPDVLLLLGDLYFNVYKGCNDYITTGRYNYFNVDPNFVLLESTVLYLNELEGRKDNQLALTYYLSAANKGNAEAWMRLGFMLISGLTLSEQMSDKAALEGAIEYFLRSVEGGCLCAYNSLAPLAISQENTLKIEPQKMQYVLRGRDSLLNIKQRIDENIKRQYEPIIVHLKNNFIKQIQYAVNTEGKEEIIQEALDEALIKLNSLNNNYINRANQILYDLEDYFITVLSINDYAYQIDKYRPLTYVKHSAYRFDYLNEWAKRDATSLKMAISCFLAAEDNQIVADNWNGAIGHEITNMDQVRKFLKADKKKGHLYAGIVMREVGHGWNFSNEDLFHLVTQWIPAYNHSMKFRNLCNLKLVSKLFNEKISTIISNDNVVRFSNLKVREDEYEAFFENISKFKSVALDLNKYSENIFQNIIQKDLSNITSLKLSIDAGEYSTLKVLKRLPSELKELDVFCNFQPMAMSKFISGIKLANNTILKKFVLRAPRMDNAQLIQLGKSLEKNSTLEKIELRSGSLFMDSDFHVLLKNNSLTTLKIAVSDHTIQSIQKNTLKAIKGNKKICNFVILPILNLLNENLVNLESYSSIIESIHKEYLSKIIFDHSAYIHQCDEYEKIKTYIERNKQNLEKI